MGGGNLRWVYAIAEVPEPGPRLGDPITESFRVKNGDATCPKGGTITQTGYDDGWLGGTAGDGVLQSGEVTETIAECNGGGGSDGGGDGGGDGGSDDGGGGNGKGNGNGNGKGNGKG
jgi:hypothetical protein